ncbi:MAG: NADPH:quinone reductase [Acidobacteria bacterium]|nr:NADPH:quinone reductase [Acidobacteriota bacterium]
MKAIIVREFGAADVLKLEETDVPAVGEKQVLVRIMAAGVNPVDTYIRTGTYAQKPALPYTPGKDAAGVVERTGAGAARFKAGDRVLSVDAGSGTYAEYAVFDEDGLIALPENVSFEQGAGVFVPYATAYRALFQKARAKAGETVLVHGASGGVGTAAIQWAKNAGLTVIGTAGSAAGLELVKEQGADFAVDHTKEDYLREILEITGGRGVEVILEMLANVNLQKDFEVLARFGRISIVGNRGSLDFNPRAIMGKDASVFGMALFNAPADEMRELHEAIHDGLAKGFLRPVVGRTFPLAEAAAAHRAVIEDKARGKIIISISDFGFRISD